MSKVLGQWWLYKCEVCGTASFTDRDHGNAWYANCGSCRAWGYHDNVNIVTQIGPWGDVGCIFMSTSDQEENDASTKVDEH